MMRSKKTSGQSLIWLVCIALLAMTSTLAACGGQNADDSQTAEFRAAMVSKDDVMMTYDGSDTRASGLNGQLSGIAALTAGTVVKTNLFLGGHIALMRFIVSLPPQVVETDHRVWQGTHDGFFIQVDVTRSDAPRGTRFDYAMKARPADDDSAPMLTIFDGFVVRIETRPNSDHQGWGIVRYHFDNYNALKPDAQVGGTARLAFRRVGHVRQVRVRLIDIKTPKDPNFPPAAAYDYVLLPNHAGRLKWFARADFNKDGQQPLEDIAVNSYWRSDLSGAGVGWASGGTLAVDYVRDAECWNTHLQKTYSMVSSPDGDVHDGDRASCAQNTDDLEPPTYQDSLADEDPALPTADPNEQ